MPSFTRETFPKTGAAPSTSLAVKPASLNPPNVQTFRLDYQNGIYVLISIDVNNYYDTASGGPYQHPGDYPWLTDWSVYQNSTLLYVLSDLEGFVLESVTGTFPFNDPYNMTLNPGIAFWTYDGNLYPNFYNLMTITSLGYFDMETFAVTYAYPCFKEGSKILTDQGYKLIEMLRKGDKIQTVKHGFVPIDMIGCRTIFHPANLIRVTDQLYRCPKSAYPELTEDLIITGAHSILVSQFKNKEEEEHAIEVNKGLYVTDGLARLPAVADHRTVVYDIPGSYTIYHLALENTDYYMNYGIYANGLLVETCSKRYLKELSNMTLLE
jgi:hypothetical protein